MFQRLIPLVLVLLLSPLALRADRETARADFERGSQYESNNQFPEALEAYKKSLDDDPSYFWAWKQIGNCYYHLGRNDKAIDAYQRYLAQKPDDDRVRNFAQRLQEQGNGSVAGQETPPPAPETPSSPSPQPAPQANPAPAPQPAPQANTAITPAPRPHHRPETGAPNHFKFGLNLGYASYAMNDWNNAVNSSGSGGNIYGGMDFGLDFQYAFSPHLAAGLFLENLFTEASTYYTTYFDPVNGNVPESVYFNFPAVFVGPQFVYYQRLSPIFLGSFSVGVGYLGLGNAYNTASDTLGNVGSANYYGNGLGVRVGLGGDFIASSHFTLGGFLGYRFARIQQINYSGPGGSGTLQNNGNNVPLDYSGITLDFDLGFWL